MEKLTYEDAMLLENVVSKMNEIIDRLEAIDVRIDKHWSYHRHKSMENETPINKDKENV